MVRLSLPRSKTCSGFTLVELAVVILTIGVLAALGIPRFIKSIERSKAVEAFAFLSEVRSAQERCHGRDGRYVSSISELDIFNSTHYFTIGTISAKGTGSLDDSWSLTLTRVGPSAGYGAYTVTFNEDGYDASNSTIDGLPDINPGGA